ncbi:MAG: rRNA maturation RNase YbeY [Patescibacteria group bacterium]
MSVSIIGRSLMGGKKITRIIKLCARQYRKMPGTVNVIFISPAKIQALNKKYRRKNKATTILSFDLRTGSRQSRVDSVGEIYICLPLVRLMAKRNKDTLTEALSRLIIHGCQHLAGFTHQTKRSADKMERAEKKLAGKLVK